MVILQKLGVYLIGFAQALTSSPFLFPIVTFQEPVIRRKHERIHKNFLRTPILLEGSSPQRIGSCAFGLAFLPFETECATNLTASFLNLTTAFDSTRSDIPGPYTSTFLQGEELSARLEVYFTGTSGLTYDIDTYFLHDLGDGFICISNVQTVGLMVFIQAYDLLTWIVAVSACLCLSAALAVMSDRTETSYWAKLQSAAQVVLMLLIERFYGYSQVISTASRQVVLVITLWAFGAMLLGMCYSGNMIGYMTSPSPPPCPHDLEELIISEYPILTPPVVVGVVDDEYIWGTQYRRFTKEYLRATPNGSLASLVRKFDNTLTVEEGNSDLDLFAYASVTYDMKIYGMLSLTLGNNKHVVSGGDLPIFKQTEVLLVQRNCFSHVFRRCLGAIQQSGLKYI